MSSIVITYILGAFILVIPQPQDQPDYVKTDSGVYLTMDDCLAVAEEMYKKAAEDDSVTIKIACIDSEIPVSPRRSS